jgi:hypothetical protein
MYQHGGLLAGASAAQNEYYFFIVKNNCKYKKGLDNAYQALCSSLIKTLL